VSRQDRLTMALRDAMKARDKVAVAALRSVLGDVGNAEAVPVGGFPAPGGSDETPFAGSVEGIGAAEAARRELSDADVAAIVQAAIDERDAAAAEYRGLGRDEEAEALDAEASVLRSLLD
jgi:uncharacterized protein YqeY